MEEKDLEQKKSPEDKTKRTDEENTRTAGGALGGAILGASIGGPVGALFGGVFGAFLGEAKNESNKGGKNG